MEGLFYSWSVSVISGLATLGDENYLSAFQSMNRVIINLVFLIVFMGLLNLFILLSYLSYNKSTLVQLWFIFSVSGNYIAGIMLITFLDDVPLNNSLKALKIKSMSVEQIASFRLRFESK